MPESETMSESTSEVAPKSLPFTHKFTLDKQHFTECFEQTSQGDYSVNAYFKAIILIAFGVVVVLFTDINKYTAWFVFALGILEVLSIKYQKPWWVTRQMLSKASNSEVTLTIDEDGVACSSFYVNSNVTWESMTQIEITPLGWVIHNGKSRFYIAKKGVSLEAVNYIKAQSEKVAANQAKKQTQLES